MSNDPSDFAQDASFHICATASEVQRTSSQWRDAAHKGKVFDRQHVVISLRDAAKRLYELADQIERRPE